MLISVPTADSAAAAAAAAAAISPAMADAARSPTHLPSAAGEAVGGELRKRRRDWGSAAEEDGFSAGFDDGEASKRRGKPQDVVFRVVVPSRQIGRVIGKEGSQIRSIREDTRATIKIADAVSRHEERVIIISSKNDDSLISDAESALYHIARAILKADDGNTEAEKVGTPHGVSNMVKLLITGSQAGSLIGISGQTIEKIRNSSGATVMILDKIQLPSCASAHVSDRLVQVSGQVPEVLLALEKIGSKLRENPPTKVISIRPSHNTGSRRSNGSLPSGRIHDSMQLDELVSMDLMISEAHVGGLIGKQGSNISKIRNESGATIKVSGARGEAYHRMVHFSGTSEQVAVAKSLVERYIYSQSVPQSISMGNVG